MTIPNGTGRASKLKITPGPDFIVQDPKPAVPAAPQSPYPIYQLTKRVHQALGQVHLELSRVYDGVRPPGQYETRFDPAPIRCNDAQKFSTHLQMIYNDLRAPFWFTFRLGETKEHRLVRGFSFPMMDRTRFYIEYEHPTNGVYRVAIDPLTLRSVTGEVWGELFIARFTECSNYQRGCIIEELRNPLAKIGAGYAHGQLAIAGLAKAKKTVPIEEEEEEEEEDDEDAPSKTVVEARAKKAGKTNVQRDALRQHLIENGSGGVLCAETFKKVESVMPSDADRVVDELFAAPPAKPTPPPAFYDDDFVRPSGDGMLTIRKPGRFVGEV